MTKVVVVRFKGGPPSINGAVIELPHRRAVEICRRSLVEFSVGKSSGKLYDRVVEQYVSSAVVLKPPTAQR